MDRRELVRRCALCAGLLAACPGVLCAVCAGEAAASPAGGVAAIPATPAACRRLAGEAEANLERQILAPWFPRAVDRDHGGFYEVFDARWRRPKGDPNLKSVVYQSRLTWVASQAALRFPGRAAEYLGDTRHGLACLAGRLWDARDGGLFWQVTPEGGPAPDRGGEKHAYGIAFAVYAASGAYQATRDAAALDLARRAFLWLDARAHDPQNGGYYEALTRDGAPILAPPAGAAAPPNDAIGTRYGYKSMNTHIHLLEAFTALYGAWPDAVLRQRLEELFGIVRDRIAVPSVGCLNLFFTPDWRAVVPDHDSFGHDVETAYLLAETAEALGRPDDPETWRVARKLVDHALDFGWDAAHGGFFDAGSAFEPATVRDKVWWTQAEGLNALLLMHERCGRETPRYWDAFVRQWAFIQQKQVDRQNGGWITRVREDGTVPPGQPKSDPWKDPYHQGRALLNVTARLRRLAAAA